MKKILIILLLLLFFLLPMGCSQDKRIVVKPEPVDNWDRWMALAPYVKKHFDTGDKTIEEIAFELLYAEYKMSLE